MFGSIYIIYTSLHVHTTPHVIYEWRRLSVGDFVSQELIHFLIFTFIQKVTALLKNEGIEWREENRGSMLIKLDGRKEFNFINTECDSE